MMSLIPGHIEEEDEVDLSPIQEQPLTAELGLKAAPLLFASVKSQLDPKTAATLFLEELFGPSPPAMVPMEFVEGLVTSIAPEVATLQARQIDEHALTAYKCRVCTILKKSRLRIIHLLTLMHVHVRETPLLEWRRGHW